MSILLQTLALGGWGGGLERVGEARVVAFVGNCWPVHEAELVGSMQFESVLNFLGSHFQEE